MRARLLTVPAVLILAATACSQDETGPAPTRPATTTATELSPSQLRSSLLTLGDMVTDGYVQTDVDEDRARTYFCDYEPPAEPSETVMSEFEKSDDSSFSLVRSVVDQFESTKDAAAQIDTAAKTLETCRSATVAGTEQTYTVVPAPELGNRSLAVRIETAVNDLPVVIHQVYVQTANAIQQTSTAVGGTETADAEEVTALATIQADKLAEAGR